MRHFVRNQTSDLVYSQEDQRFHHKRKPGAVAKEVGVGNAVEENDRCQVKETSQNRYLMSSAFSTAAAT